MMNRIVAATAALLLLGATGCMYSNIEEHWGESTREMLARQTDDAEGAAANAAAPGPQGTDGRTAVGAINKHRDAGSAKGGASLPLPMIVTDTTSASGL
jgi:hypothetical protein